MRRRLARGFFVLICGTVAAVLGIASAVLWSPPGLRLIARFINVHAQGMIRGSVAVGSVQGDWLRGFAIEDVVIRDSTGAVFAVVPRLTVKYRLRNILGGRILIESASLQQPTIQIVKRRTGGRLNYQEIFKLGERPRGTGPSQLIEIRNLTIDSGQITIRLPWNPDGRLRTRRQIDSALAEQRSRPGRRIEEGREGLEIVRTLDRFSGEFPRVLVSSPDQQPTTVEIARLATLISDPGMEVRHLAGTVRTRDDSLLFELTRAELPGTVGSGAGRLDWPRDTVLYGFSFEGPRVALADFRWVSPFFPDFTGSARLVARSLSGARTEWRFPELDVGDSVTRVNGRLVAITDVYRGLGFRGLELSLANLDMDAVRPYLDTLPLHGTISGPLRADGFFDGMTVALDWRFQDARVPGGAESRIRLGGNLELGGAEGMFFGGTRLEQSDIDLRTVRLIAPAVILEGRLTLDGTLSGPWQNVVFNGTAAHRDGERPVSHLSGSVRLDTRAEMLALEADVVLDSLHFEGIRPSFPTLTAKGAVGGRVGLIGPLDRLQVNADVGVAGGQLRALGQVTLTPPTYGADSLRIRFEGINLASLSATAADSRLTGAVLVTGRMGEHIAPTGRLEAALGPGRFREVSFDTATARLHAADSLITVDTVSARWQQITVAGSGAIGWRRPKSGRMTLHADLPDLAPLDSLALALTGFERDTLRGEVTLGGRGSADITLTGSIDALTLGTVADIDSVRWLGYLGKGLRADVSYQLRDSVFRAGLEADSLYVRSKAFSNLQVDFAGTVDDFRWYGAGQGRNAVAARAGGTMTRLGDTRVVHADSAVLRLLGRTWQLEQPLDARMTEGGISLDTVRLVTADGSGSVELRGQVPGRAPGELSVTALGVEVKDLYGLMQLDTTGLKGAVALDARLGGTLAEPTLRGSSTVTGAVFGDVQAPLIRAAFDYRERLLRSNLTFWRTGEPVVEVDASLPFDMALTRVAERQLPGPVNIIAKGDSVDLGIIEALTGNLRNVRGTIDMDARVEGTWNEPRLAGFLNITGGAAEVPGLGVHYLAINGNFRFAGDSITTDSLRVLDDEGSLLARGGIRLVRLTQPELNIGLSAIHFELIDSPNYMKLRTWGDVRLSGPIARPVLTGATRLTESVIYFADLLTKDVVNLEDPMNADLVDTLELRQQDLRATFQSRFLDSLTVRDLDFIFGEAVWLRSLEANFQLEGRVRVNKTRSVYRIDGTLNTPRGTYTLDIPPLLNRTFTVERGTVRYFGDLNAELDVEATHTVRNTQGGGDIPVIAHIGGTLEVPKLTLRTPPDRPPIPEPQLISLLVFGTLAPIQGNQFAVTTDNALAYATSYATTTVFNELQRSILGTSEGTFEIRPGLTSAGFIGGTSAPTTVAVGRALSSKLFITANAGFCLSSGQTFGARNLGASLEYRFVRDLRAVISAEPLQTCFSQGLAADALATTRRYQFGAELRWDRNY